MAFPGLRVLVIDDEQPIRKLFGDVLSYWECDVEMAVNGREGVEKYGQFRPDLVLMDLEMPEMNGFDASRSIMDLDPRAVILIVTGFPESPLAQKASELRVVKAVIPKLFDLAQLRTAIQAAITETRPPSQREVRCKLSFVLFALSARIEYEVELPDEGLRGLKECLSEISDDLLKMV